MERSTSTDLDRPKFAITGRFVRALIVAGGIFAGLAGCGDQPADLTARQGAASATPTFVQVNAATPQSSAASVSVPFNATQTAGDFIAVIVGWTNATAQVTSVTDTSNNVYQLAIGPTKRTTVLSQSIYYAKNIAGAAAGANVVTVAFSPAAPFPDVRILEYANIDRGNPLDVAVGNSGKSATSNSGSVTTTNASDLLVAGTTTLSGVRAAGANYTLRILTTPDEDCAQDRVVTATGSLNATATLATSDNWVAQMAAFRALPLAADTQPPTAPAGLTATAASATQINLAWTAATDNVGVSAYLVERCQGVGCSTFTQVASVTTTTFNSTGLTASTSYSFRVRAADAAGNTSPYSNTATATTAAVPDTQKPTAPSGLAATAASSSQVNLTWTASTDNVGVTAYLVERCQGSGCSSFAQIGTSPTTAFADTGVAGSTLYRYRVRATDAAGNLSSYSSTVNATTPAGPDTQPPTAPSALTATANTASQITLTWTAATDNVGVTAYLVERCQGAGCATFAQVGSASVTTFKNTSLDPSTSYTFRVRATDAAGNLGGYSNVASATTLFNDTQAPSAPSNLTATTISSAQINLAWTAATDDVGVTAYLVERCQGAGCATFAQVTTTPGASFNDTGLAGGTSYSYRVRATDAASNLGGYSNVASATTPVAPVTPAFVQVNAAVPQTAQTTVALSYKSAQTAGNLNVVVVGWNDSTAQVTSVTDNAGNAYALAVGPTAVSGVLSQSIYYARNIAGAAANANTVSVKFSPAAAFPDVRILEYSGVDAANPLDVIASGQGTNAASVTAAVATTNAVDLLVGANMVATGTANATGGYTSRVITNPDGDIAEDRVVTSAAAYLASAQLSSAGAWVMQMAAFRAAGSAPPPPPDTTPPAVAVTSPVAGATLTLNAVVTVTATDASGVNSVQLLVDGAPVGAAVTTVPYQFTLDTTAFISGAHTIGAQATDPFLNLGAATPVPVTFANQPNQLGAWSAPNTLPIVSVHSALLPGGNVLMWDGQSWGPDARVWTPATNATAAVRAPSNIFCGAQQQMADGRIMVVGGHVGAHVGLTDANIFNPVTSTWTPVASMANPRWYPSLTALPDGRLIVMGGESNCNGCNVSATEIYDPASDTWTTVNAPWTWPYYPHVYVLPDGSVIVPAATRAPIVSEVLDLNTLHWSAIGGAAVDGGSSVMYVPGKFLKTGTSVDPDLATRSAAATAYVLDTTQPSPTWRAVAPMNFARTFHSLTVLPDGTVLASGGGPTTAATDTANAVLTAELWSPATETWTLLAAMHTPRLYHSEALLLPDGRVEMSGGGRFDDLTAPTDQFSTEIFSPPYLFKGPQPVITGAPSTLQYGQAFTVQTPDAARIAAVSLIRYGAVTHSINMGQRFLPLSFAVVDGGSLTVTAPANANLAPPGNYMLFILDTNGVPSVAATVHF